MPPAIKRLLRWLYAWMPPAIRRLLRSFYAKMFPTNAPGLLYEMYQMSYSQFGEDIVFDYAFHLKGIDKPTYLDVGAFKPVALNNTFRLYTKGSRGVLVEPNAELCVELRAERPGDVVLNCAIRTRDMPAV